MKSVRIFFLGIAFCVPFGLLSCLDENPKDSITGDQAYNSADNLAKNAVGNLYNYIGGSSESQGLQGTYRGVYDLNTFTTDEAMLPTRGGDWYDGGFWQNLYLHKWTASDNSLKNTWNYLYKVIILCNQSLTTLEKDKSLLTDAQLTAYNAEVRGIRAMYYWYAMDLFGRIPVVTSSSAQLSDIKQSSRSETFHFIVDELQECLPKLVDERSNQENKYYGRFTRPVAEFVLAKLMLNAEIYADDNWVDAVHPSGNDMEFTVGGNTVNAWEACIYYCNRIENEGYVLEDEYSQNFSVHNETSKENIFTIPMDKFLYANQFQYLFRSRHYNHGAAIGMDAENGSCATVSTVRAYGYGTENVDSRYGINFYSDTLYVDGSQVLLDNGKALVYQPLAVKINLTGDAYEKTAGARMSKYEIDRNSYADGKLQSNDIVLFRFADVLLMRAEAKVRSGESGQEDFDRVRNRVGSEQREATLSNILEERLLELMWEGWRRNDLIRFNLFHQAYDQRPQLEDEAGKPHTTVFPIPSTALELNEGLTQNWVYEGK